MSDQPAPMDWEAYAKSLEVDAGLAVAQWEAEKEAHFATAQERDRAVEALRQVRLHVNQAKTDGGIPLHAALEDIDAVAAAVLAEQEKEQPK